MVLAGYARCPTSDYRHAPCSRRRMRSPLLLWCLVLAALLPGCAVLGEDEEGDDGEEVATLGEELVTSGAGVVNTDDVNLRSAASTSAGIVQVLDRGTRVTITGAKKSAN